MRELLEQTLKVRVSEEREIDPEILAFKQDLYRDFRKEKPYVLKGIRSLLPNMIIKDIGISGSFEVGIPTERSDVDLRVTYVVPKGMDVDSSREIVMDTLIGRTVVAGNMVDIHPDPVTKS